MVGKSSCSRDVYSWKYTRKSSILVDGGGIGWWIDGMRYQNELGDGYADYAESLQKSSHRIILCSKVIILDGRLINCWCRGHIHTTSRISIDSPCSSSITLLSLDD